MKKYFLITPGLILVFVFISSCIIAVVDYSETGVARLSREFHKVVSFVSGGTLSLENVNGDVEIAGWDRDEVEISAERMIPLPYGRRIQWQPIRRSMPRVDFDKFEDFIKIKARSSGGDKEAAAVNFYLNAPHSIKLKDIVGREGNISLADLYGEAVIDLQNGKIKVENFSGSLIASLVKGIVEASLYDLRGEDEIRITVREGDITIHLQAEVKARVEASASNGNIYSDFDLKETLPAKKISGQIGEGGAFISLSSLNGDIQIKKL